MRYYDNTNKARTLADKYAYIKNHFQYFTLNSWNKTKSIANCVKVYSMNLTDANKAFDIVFCPDEQFTNEAGFIIEDSGLNIGVNGRTGGYLVLYPEKGRASALRGDYYEDDYKTAKDEGDIDRETLLDDFDIVQRFDRTCDEVRDLLEYYIKHAEVVEETYTETITRTCKRTRFDDEVTV